MSSTRRVSGLHAVESALQNAPERIVKVWLDEQRLDAKVSRLTAALKELRVPMESVTRSKLDTLSESKVHQGIVVELTMPDELGEADLRNLLENLPPNPLLLVLDQVQDPHNLGACLRISDAVGVHGIVIPKDQSVGLTPVVTKVASGAAETIKIFRVTNLVRALGWMKDSGLWIVGASGETNTSIYDANLDLPAAVVMGAEGKGLRRLTRENCDLLVKIPMMGQVESLNVSVATGVVLYELQRQRGLCL